MRPILILYATRQGQARRVAEHVGSQLKASGFSVDVIEARHIPAELSLSTYSAAILAASVHGGKHESEMVRFVRRHKIELQQCPGAFLSVSLSQAGAQDVAAPPERRDQAAADVKRMISLFLTRTQWHPTRVVAVAGALMYSKYNFFLRFIMKRIARQAGASTDSSRDHEFTDWAALDRTIANFITEEVRGQDVRIPA